MRDEYQYNVYQHQRVLRLDICFLPGNMLYELDIIMASWEAAVSPIFKDVSNKH